jgi:hypothetical protein
VATVQVEDVLYELPEIERAAVYGVPLPGTDFELPVATLVVRAGHRLDPAELARHVEKRLDGHARPRVLRLRDELPLSVGQRVLKQQLRAQALDASAGDDLRYDEELKLYEPLDAAARNAMFGARPAIVGAGSAQPSGRVKSGTAKPKSKRPKHRG